MNRNERIHDYVQSYCSTYAYTWLPGAEDPIMLLHERSGNNGDGQAYMHTIRSPSVSRRTTHTYDIDDIRMAPTPIQTRCCNIRIDAGHEACLYVSRRLRRNWKRGLSFGNLMIHSYTHEPDHHDWTVSGLIEPNYCTSTDVRRRQVDGSPTSVAIAPDLVLVNWDEQRRTRNPWYLHWNSHLVGSFFPATNRVTIMGEYSYLSPKLEDYFGGVDVC